jgi:hypothetical protein
MHMQMRGNCGRIKDLEEDGGDISKFRAGIIGRYRA